MKVIKFCVREPEKNVEKAKEKMKITHQETFLRGRGSFGYFNINSFAFNSIGKAFTVS